LFGYLGVSTPEEAETKVKELCSSAFGATDIFPFEKVTNKGRQFDLEFFNGGGKLNSLESNSLTLADQTARLNAVASNVLPSQIITWPYDLPGLDSCDAQAVTCCWTADKFDVGDGTCTSATGCVDEDPVDNTDVCSVNMVNSRRASRVEEGYALFPGDSEGPVNCHGFAWGDGDEEFKGNALFHVAMQKGLMENGYVHNVPGAPMCGCVENMPVVSNAGCSKVVSSQSWRMSLEESRLALELTDLNLSFEDCGEDLATHYSSRFEGRDIDDFVTGECDDRVEDEMLRPTSVTWTPLVGIGNMYEPETISEAELRSLVNADPNNLKIIRRRCRYCWGAHKDIYYKRLTPIPDDIDQLDILKQRWHNIPGHIWHEDFELYTTYKNAKDGTKPWQACNFDDRNVGFPRDCGPVYHIGGQWNTIPGPVTGTNSYGQQHVTFYIED